MTGAEILDLPMGENDAGANNIREYLKALLMTLWEKEEGFSGKRPFGNSGWQNEIMTALVKGGAVPGKLDADGYLESVEAPYGYELVCQAIEALTAAR